MGIRIFVIISININTCRYKIIFLFGLKIFLFILKSQSHIPTCIKTINVKWCLHSKNMLAALAVGVYEEKEHHTVFTICKTC